MVSVITSIAPMFIAAVEGSAALGAAIAVFACLGAAFAIGMATSKTVESIARQPEAEGKIFKSFMLGLVFAETTAIYATFIALMIIVMN